MLKNKKIFLAFIGLVLFFNANAQCCEDPACKAKAKEYADKITSLAILLGKCTPPSNPNSRHINDSIVEVFRTTYPERYNEFKTLVKKISEEFIDDPSNQGKQRCFQDMLPIAGDNAMAWINHIRNVKPIFPSTEFCGGFKKRVEISQGAAFINKNTTAYLGTARFFIVYTLPVKEKCGGKVRLMVGPAYFIQSRNSYLTLSSRVGVRIGDIKPGIFSLGNFNFFGGYSTAFGDFNYAETGFEVELGWLGFNLSTLYQTNDHHWGLLTGLVLFNTKKTKKKKEI